MALEFRTSHRDDAWYHAHIVTSEDNGGDHHLRIKFANFGDDRDEFVNTKDLTSLQDLEDLRSRVRRLSIKLQDSECPKVEKGLLVCAAGSVQTDDGDDRRYYYDAIIDEVVHKEHRFVEGEQQCPCTFILEWIHGPQVGTLSVLALENLCRVQLPAIDDEVDPSLSSFLNAAQEKISSLSKSNKDTSCARGSLPPSSSSKELIDNPSARDGHDMDIGRVPHMISVENLEKGISSSTIMEFIYEQLSISCQAFVLPSKPSEAYTRGIIMLNGKKNLDKLSEFLESPHWIIISSRGRPWVVTQNTLLDDTLRARIETFKLTSQTAYKSRTRSSNELMVVISGSQEHRKAKWLKDSFKRSTNHQRGHQKRLLHEEGRILLPAADKEIGHCGYDVEKILRDYKSNLAELKQQYGGQFTSKMERMIVSGTTIAALIIQNHIIIGVDSRCTDPLGDITDLDKLRHFTPHIVGAFAGDVQAGLQLFGHLDGMIRAHNPTVQTQNILRVNTVASWALTYLKSQRVDKVSVLIAGHDTSGKPHIFSVDVSNKYPIPYLSLTLGNGGAAAASILDSKVVLYRHQLSFESAKLLVMDALIAAAVEDASTGNSLNVYEMTQEHGCLIVSTRGVLEGYADRFDILGLKPDKEDRVLFLLPLSNNFNSDYFNEFLREQKISKCINLGRTHYGSSVYRAVFRNRAHATLTYNDAIYAYDRDARRFHKRGHQSPYSPFQVELSLLAIEVRWVYVDTVSRVLLCRIASGDQLRILREIPFQNWPVKNG